MDRDTSTMFPEEIDPRVYFGDTPIEQLHTKETYDEELAEQRYSDASSTLFDSDTHYYGAYIFNLLENRLVAIQEHLQDREKPEWVKFQSTEPSDPKFGLSWIS